MSHVQHERLKAHSHRHTCVCMLTVLAFGSDSADMLDLFEYDSADVLDFGSDAVRTCSTYEACMCTTLDQTAI